MIFKISRNVGKRRSNRRQFKIRCCALLSLSLLSVSASASSIYLAVDRYEYDIELGGFDLDLDPFGLALGGEVGITNSLVLHYEFGDWSDDPVDMGLTSTFGDFSSTLMNVGLQKSVHDWQFGVSYTQIVDQVGIIHGRDREFYSTSELDLTSIKLVVGRQKQFGRWEGYYSLGLHFDDIRSVAVYDQLDHMVLHDSQLVHIMAKVGGDYFLPKGSSSGWFFGSALSLHQQLSSDDQVSEFSVSTTQLSTTVSLIRGGNVNARAAGNNVTGGANINRTFGDTFGLLDFYATYKINDYWSVDWSSSFGVAGEANANSHALTVGFAF